MAASRPNTLFILLILALVIIVGIFLISSFPGQEHANTKHPEARKIRDRIFSNRCEKLSAYFSPEKGQLLFLCYMPDLGDGMWGGLFFKIATWTGGSGYKFVTPEKVREVTTFANTMRDYWGEELIESGYRDISFYPQVWDYFCAVMGW